MPTDTRTDDEVAQPIFSTARRKELLLFIIISAVLLVPCFWHRHIEAGDLGSHVYNAWLAQLIEQGRAPGLYIAQQWNNVLFDVLLSNFSKLFGFAAGEKLAVSFAVLVFFWGVFLLMKAVSSRPPWFLTPCLAMLTYGHIFHLGFLNYYISLGFASMALALLWNGSRNGLIGAALLSPIVFFAHPLGFLLLVGVGSYCLLAQKTAGWLRWVPPLTSLAIFLVVRWYIAHHPGYLVQWREVPWWHMTGVDQFHVFGERYKYIKHTVSLLAVASSVVAVIAARGQNGFWKERRQVLEIYLLSFCAILLLPENVQIDPAKGWVGEVGTRLTLFLAIFALCWLASLPPRRWQLLGYAAVAAVFFTFVYQDTAFLNRMERNTEEITRQLPFGTRTLATFFAPDDYRTPFMHIADRACIGHCFLFSNYEPSTQAFRIRVRAGSPVVTASVDDSEDMQSGTYDVQEEDLPLKQIYQCDGRDLTLICIRDLAADEKNGRIGYHSNADVSISQNP